ncbi:MAG: helix-turn-helix transcriptional regulator [Clostridia bacterium]|nr:helix-turn-helix transcriptional regulator [Clostridia bacterium]
MKLKDYRVQCGLSQKDFAKKIGENSSTVSMWENGKTIPRLSKMSKIANELNITIDALIQCLNNEQL